MAGIFLSETSRTTHGAKGVNIVSSLQPEGYGNDFSSKETAVMEYMKEGVWFIGVFNDADTPQTVGFIANHHGIECPHNCSGRGDCVDGECQCWEGYQGKYCSLDQCPVVCNNQGEIVEGRCRCFQGFKGPDCSLREHMCVVPNCNGNGHCINGLCVCLQGFQGPDCGIDFKCYVPGFSVRKFVRKFYQYTTILELCLQFLVTFCCTQESDGRLGSGRSQFLRYDDGLLKHAITSVGASHK
ncbi:hypothetical protein C0Q70_06262 [Pomacea canaliculata]|uniref:EGF-like domain-containing protein n=1 Tax=Pomacea canaliculata TaxID=400727 RepID=A0A2T7PNI1_POMCA|nr:hypothetical protein C0Q70_06262 [Pomacea canaliculata]